MTFRRPTALPTLFVIAFGLIAVVFHSTPATSGYQSPINFTMVMEPWRQPLLDKFRLTGDAIDRANVYRGLEPASDPHLQGLERSLV
jgi:hypothetical protein